MAPRPDVSEERRLQIIEAAIRLLVRKGYRKTTMPDVAREAGLSIGGIYWYFKSKDEIVSAILGQCFQRDLEYLHTLLAAEAPLSERIRAFAEAYTESFKQFAWMNPVGIEFHGEAAHNPEVSGYIQEYLAHYRTALVRLIEQGRARGEVSTAVNPEDVANIFLGLEEGLALLLNADPQHVRWRESFLLGVDLLIAGLVKEKNA